MTRITFEGSRFPVREGETALDALLRGGANVSFSCRRGSCRVCLLRATAGALDEDAQKGLREDMRARGYFLPCVSKPRGEVYVERPALSELFERAVVASKRALSRDVVALSLETMTALSWRGGQYLNVRRSDGTIRSYSIASLDEDYYLELHVQRVPGGAMSNYLCDELAVGDELDVQGPVGDCFYDPLTRERPLLLIGTGTGLAPLYAIARDALRNHHAGAIHLYHGARTREGLYLGDELRALAREHASFHYRPCVSRQEGQGDVTGGRAVDVAFREQGELAGAVAFLCGHPGAVEEARVRAYAAGIARRDLHADPFTVAHDRAPRDAEKLANLRPDPELWAALDHGRGLRAILEDFYARVFEDPRLVPFFHNVTKQRAIDKQYEFLRLVLSGEGSYLGLNPFNAHHWMVISDELFDYREALIEDCMRRYGLSEEMIRRWGRVHEVFRAELVKTKPRGMFIAGVEQPAEGYSDEVLDVATICDGCSAEMLEGARGRMHVRTGQLFCSTCAARRVGATQPPPA